MKRRPVKDIKAELKFRCLEALVDGLKGYALEIPTDGKKSFKIKVNKIADYMVKEMWKKK